MRKHGILAAVLPYLGRKTQEKPPARAGGPTIDFPQAGETVLRGHYAIRISAGEGACQVSIDGGDWQDCRSEAGFFWFDWSPEQPGTHRLCVRARVGAKWVKAEKTCEVR